MARIKVYGGLGCRVRGVKNPRMIVAATSRKKVDELTGIGFTFIRDYWCETGNDVELEVALERPGVVFYRDDIGGIIKKEDYKEWLR